MSTRICNSTESVQKNTIQDLTVALENGSRDDIELLCAIIIQDFDSYDPELLLTLFPIISHKKNPYSMFIFDISKDQGEMIIMGPEDWVLEDKLKKLYKCQRQNKLM